jgi:hypothetical protein
MSDILGLSQKQEQNQLPSLETPQQLQNSFSKYIILCNISVFML